MPDADALLTQDQAAAPTTRDDFLTGSALTAYDLPVKAQTPNPDALLTRDQTAAALTAAGFPVKAKTLATMVTRGGGPAYRRFGPRALYRWSTALEWAQSRLSAPISSTSELDAA
jgi:hypothetical protein